ncbi:MAG: GNAT family N-acetyltransferase [Bacteroidota bacterium]
MSPSHTDVSARLGTLADAAFLARIDYFASLPPDDHCFWDDLLAPTGTTALAFLEAQIAVGASAWGQPSDHVILERDGVPLAACAVLDNLGEDGDLRPLRLSRLPALAARLGWTDAVRDAFQARYDEAWPATDTAFLAPQASAIVEAVGGEPEARGQGLGQRLMAEAFEEARRRGHPDLGVMVLHGNTAAQRLYERVGFEPVLTFHAACFGDEMPGVTKYRVALN